ncbi:DUF5988 family protein [Streptomyces melanogenes]|uniref:DUF5988 family protein n=1 Tax=Streptomyces melanogenes TaxID=67326 RepID=A0ABZ1XD95_9ACTN|nr:DUF5988 family protein [Streptomyces melanogenes]
MITIALEGAPDGLEGVRQLARAELPATVVVAYYGRHQHFERTGRTVRIEGRDVPVFRFTYSTAIAE